MITFPARKAFGGVVVSRRGRILLRRPTHGFGGMSWTFPKGGQDAGETPQQTALREVREETGLHCTIIGKLPGTYQGETSSTEYFLMQPIGRQESFDDETEALAWVPLDEVSHYLEETVNDIGYFRDRAVLAQVYRTLNPMCF